MTTALVAWLGLLPSSCTTAKKAGATKPVSAVEIASQCATNKNLGELSLTNHYETCVNLGAGKSCTIKPTLLGRSSIQLTMSLESKGTNGKTKDLSVVQVVTKAGKPFEVAVGNMNLTLTPLLSE
ncbi:MAG: hypothetical protein PHY43_08790 [Verrucomicrobiales bacterium]|nr:hypothetical protein [Verrucomicrobiales bacterium]